MNIIQDKCNPMQFMHRIITYLAKTEKFVIHNQILPFFFTEWYEKIRYLFIIARTERNCYGFIEDAAFLPAGRPVKRRYGPSAR